MQEIHYGRKKSGIVKELNKKLESWLNSIDDENVKNCAAKDVIVTGGSIASMLLGEKINDFDLYFRTKETTKLVAEYYVDKFNNNNNNETITGNVLNVVPIVKEENIINCKGQTEERIVIYIKSSGVAAEGQETYKYFETRPDNETVEFGDSLANPIPQDNDMTDYRPIFLSQNAITLTGKIQLIIRFYGEIDSIHSNFDYVHASCSYDYYHKRLVLPQEALECLLSRTLIYRGSLYPIASIFRMKKFIERGWRMSAGQSLKICWQISELNLKDYGVMQEQLTGVDAAYLHQLISALKDTDSEKINSTYIGVIIDKIFNEHQYNTLNDPNTNEEDIE